jgi:hypothetical protein
MHFLLSGKSFPILWGLHPPYVFGRTLRLVFPYPDPDHYAVLLSAADGTILAAKAKVSAGFRTSWTR